jgi:DNA end-binding protein Ku
MRSIWKGAIAFGLVNIPVNLHTATRNHSIRFRNLCPDHLVPLKSKRWCPEGEQEIAYDAVKKGYQVGKEFVVIEKEELDALQLKSTQTIDIEKFVDAGDVPLLAYGSFYYLSPQKGGERAYTLLHEILTLTGKIGIGKVVLWNKEHVVGIRSYQEGILLIILRYADEIVPMKDALPDELPEASEKEKELARLLVEKMEGSLDLSEYEDHYRKAVERLIEKKMKGEPVVIEEVKEAEKTKDILKALEMSIGSQ